MCEITKTTVPSVAGVAREEARKTPKAKQSSYDKLQTAIAVGLAFVVLLNMASAAFIELVVWLLFHRLAPEVWYVVRVWMIRVAWLPPVLMLKRANIRIMCSGEGELMGWSDKSPFGLSRWLALFRRETPRALVMMNHLSWADSFVLSSWLHFRNALAGDTCWPIWRWFINIPLGWVAYMSGCPFLGYGKDMDLRTMQKACTGFFTRRFTKLFIFPEGGIFREELLSKSHAFADKNGLPRLQHCLLPKAAALWVAGRTLQAQGMADVLDVTIAYPKDAAWSIDPYDVVDLIKPHRYPVRVAVHVRRRSMAEVDWSSEEKVRDWATACFKEKDKLLDQYYEDKGPMVEGWREEVSTWFEVMQDMVIMLALQAGFYWAMYAAAARAWALVWALVVRA